MGGSVVHEDLPRIPDVTVTEDVDSFIDVSNVFGGEIFKMTPREPSWTSVEDQTIVSADGVLMCCSCMHNSYIPKQIISLEELMNLLKKSLELGCEHNALMKNMKSPLFQRRRTSSEAEGNRGSTSPDQIRRTRSFTLTPSNSPKRTRKLPTKSPTESPTPKSVLLKMARQNTSNEELTESMEKSDETFQWQPQKCTKEILLDRFRTQMKWFQEKGKDYVGMETLTSLADILALLSVIVEGKTPTAVDFRINEDKSVTLSYQFVSDFRQNFMMLKIKSDYCLFLAPF